jgi:hypothetical protein
MATMVATLCVTGVCAPSPSFNDERSALLLKIWDADQEKRQLNIRHSAAKTAGKAINHSKRVKLNGGEARESA